MFNVGDKVTLYGKTLAVVKSVHNGGKKLGVKYLDGSDKSTFTNSGNVKLVTV